MTYDENALVRSREAQHVAGNILDEIRVRMRLGQERHIPLQTRTHDLERSDLFGERARP